MSTTTVPATSDEKAPEDFDDPMELAEHIADGYGVPWSLLEWLGELITSLHTSYVDFTVDDARCRLLDAESDLDSASSLDNPLAK